MRLRLHQLVSLRLLGLLRRRLRFLRYNMARFCINLYFDNVRRLRVLYVERPDQFAMLVLEFRALNCPAGYLCRRRGASVGFSALPDVQECRALQQRRGLPSGVTQTL